MLTSRAFEGPGGFIAQKETVVKIQLRRENWPLVELFKIIICFVCLFVMGLL